MPVSKSRDPVCGMMVNPEKAAGRAVHAGRTYYFCSQACQRNFQANPGVYVKEPEQGQGDSRQAHG